MCLFNANPTSKHYINTTGDVNFAEILKKIEELSFDFGEFWFRTYFTPSKFNALKSVSRNWNVESFDVVSKPSLKIKVQQKKPRSSSSSTLAVFTRSIQWMPSTHRLRVAAANSTRSTNSTRSSKLNSQHKINSQQQTQLASQNQLAAANSTRSTKSTRSS